MSRPIGVTSLLLLLLAGCSGSAPQKSAGPTPAVAATPAAAAATPVPSPAPVETAKPEAAKTAPIPAAPKADPNPTPKPAKSKASAAKAEPGSPMDRFAKCLAEQGAVMYGVFWCDHCRDQKEKFGDSFQYVKYIECVTPDAPKTLTAECKAQGIKHTPTWVFSDGERIEGVMGIDQLSMKTHCKLP